MTGTVLFKSKTAMNPSDSGAILFHKPKRFSTFLNWPFLASFSLLSSFQYRFIKVDAK